MPFLFLIKYSIAAYRGVQFSPALNSLVYIMCTGGGEQKCDDGRGAFLFLEENARRRAETFAMLKRNIGL